MDDVSKVILHYINTDVGLPRSKHSRGLEKRAARGAHVVHDTLVIELFEATSVRPYWADDSGDVLRPFQASDIDAIRREHGRVIISTLIYVTADGSDYLHANVLVFEHDRVYHYDPQLNQEFHDMPAFSYIEDMLTVDSELETHYMGPEEIGGMTGIGVGPQDVMIEEDMPLAHNSCAFWCLFFTSMPFDKYVNVIAEAGDVPWAMFIVLTEFMRRLFV